MNRVSGKVALVTGAASGLGKAIARMLAREGATVVLADINDAAGQQVLDEIKAGGATAAYVHLDTAREDDWVRAMALIEQQFEALHVTVNCAGVNVARAFPADTTLDDWRRVMSVNLDGVFLGTKHSVTLMSKARPVNGSIINISSVMGLVGYVGIAPYSASKGGVRLYSKSVALSCAERGLKIRVNSVHPGFIETPMLRQGMKSIPDPQEAERLYIALQPVGHLGEPDDIAWGVLYLASDESKFVTGAELVIDGGYTAR